MSSSDIDLGSAEIDNREADVDFGPSLTRLIKSRIPSSFSDEDLSFRRYRVLLLGTCFIGLIFTLWNVSLEILEMIQTEDYRFCAWTLAFALVHLLYSIPLIFYTAFVCLRGTFRPSDNSSFLVRAKANRFSISFVLSLVLLPVLIVLLVGTIVGNCLTNSNSAPTKPLWIITQMLAILTIAIISGILSFRISISSEIMPLCQVEYSFLTPELLGDARFREEFHACAYQKLRRGLFIASIVFSSLALFVSLWYDFAIWLASFARESLGIWWLLFFAIFPAIFELVVAILLLQRSKNNAFHQPSKGLFGFQISSYSVATVYLILLAISLCIPTVHRSYEFWLFSVSWFFYPFCVSLILSLIQLVCSIYEDRGHLIILDLIPSTNEDESLVRHTTIQTIMTLRKVLAALMLCVTITALTVFISSFFDTFSNGLFSGVIEGAVGLMGVVVCFGGALTVETYAGLAYVSPVAFVAAFISNLFTSYQIVYDRRVSTATHIAYIGNMVQILVLLFAFPLLLYLSRSVQKYPETFNWPLTKKQTEESQTNYDSLG